MSDDPYDLRRFVEAQRGEYEQACAELRAGAKRGHWMWYIFPQVRGLGFTQRSIKFGISSKEEAEAYLNHPVLGPRLRECTRLVLKIEGRDIQQIFEDPDDLKFRSSMTLFAAASSDNQIFQDALQKYFAGQPDARTLERIGSRRDV